MSSLAIVRQGSLMGYNFKAEQKKEKVADGAQPFSFLWSLFGMKSSILWRAVYSQL